MTPKDKAKELVNQFYLGRSKDDLPLTHYWTSAIGCALICVNEFIKFAPSDKSIFGTQYLTIKEYYQQVKSEIEKL